MAEEVTIEAAKNTNRELWRERDGDYYAASVFVTEGGGIGLIVGGHAIVRPIRDWHALAASQSRPTKGADLSEEFSRAAVGQAMQTAWNEVCSDTGCHPLDITHQGKKLFFDPGHWAALTAKYLFVNAIKLRLAPTKGAVLSASQQEALLWECRDYISFACSNIAGTNAESGKQLVARINGFLTSGPTKEAAPSGRGMVAEGGQWVPKVPTERMLEAGGNVGGFDAYRQKENTPAIWSAMLASAPAPSPDNGWQLVQDAKPKPHAKYQVRRNEYIHTATPCYGMHEPWWVPMAISGAEYEPTNMLDTDEWRPLPPPPAQGGGK